MEIFGGHPEYLGLLMFAGALVLIFTGYPVAFALGGTAILFGALGLVLGLFDFNFVGLFPQRIFGIMSNYTLLAIPFFIFMGVILEKSKLAESLLQTIGMLFGGVRGGLAIAVIFVGTLLAATTGVVAATVVAMGLISLPIMIRYGYSKQLASGTIAAAGTLGQIIPPSVVLVVLGDQLGVSVGDLFLGALIPGVMLSLMLMAYVAVVSFINPKLAPALPKEVIQEFDNATRSYDAPRPVLIGYGVLAAALTLFVGFRSGYSYAIDIAVLALLIGIVIVGGRWVLSRSQVQIYGAVAVAIIALVAFTEGPASAVLTSFVLLLAGLGLSSTLWRKSLGIMVPPILLILAVLGSIFFGIATPTEAGAVGSVGAILLAMATRNMNWGIIRQATLETAKFTSMVAFILIGANAFALVFRGLEGDVLVKDILVALPGGELGFLIFVNALVFILGFFIDFFEIVFIVIPLVLPAAQELGIDLVWFGIVLGMNLQTSFLTPPFGFALFYLRGVAPPEVKTVDIYKGVIPFIIVQVIALVITIAFPQISAWLPSLRQGP
ncbi:MAG: TRAP transporter large permease subunit [Meiothermus sp.]|nr:TRAP transporter large permease subunit [Meiothermus sp.]